MVVMRQGVRTRPHYGHIALQHIQELRQFIDTRRSQEPSDTRHSRIVARRLRNGWPILLNNHRPKLEYNELLAIKSFPVLPKNHRTWAIKFDRDRGESHDGREKYQRHDGHQDIDGSLYETLGFAKRQTLEFDRQYSLAL